MGRDVSPLEPHLRGRTRPKKKKERKTKATEARPRVHSSQARQAGPTRNSRLPPPARNPFPRLHIGHSTADPAENRCSPIRPSSRPIPERRSLPYPALAKALSQRPLRLRHTQQLHPPLQHWFSLASHSSSFTIQTNQRQKRRRSSLQSHTATLSAGGGLSDFRPIAARQPPIAVADYQEQHARLARSSQTFYLYIFFYRIFQHAAFHASMPNA